MLTLFTSLSNDKAGLIESYKTKLTTYNFPTVVITDYPIDIACEVFTRINTSSKPLSLFEIMEAMTYDEKKNFVLSERYEELLNGNGKDDKCLDDADFDTVSATTVMQVVASITTKPASLRGRDILRIKREDFIKNWEPTKDCIFGAVEFLRSEMRIPVSQLLPYPAMLVPLAYFFHINKKAKQPSIHQVALLEQFFYWAGLTRRYTSSADTKVGEDIKKMSEIAKGLPPKYSPDELTLETDSIRNTLFSTGNAFCKTVLCLLASQRPKGFVADVEVVLDNSYLKIASSKNYHHFFPKDYLRKVQPSKEANLIANITLIKASDNSSIGAKAPSDYIAGFKAKNPYLEQGLQTHLIGDLGAFGLLNDDYEVFLSKRSALIAERLEAKLNPNVGK